VRATLGWESKILGRWVNSEGESMESETSTPGECAESEKPRKENAELRMDSELLGKATALQRQRNIS
jgi:transposase-like protein